MTTTTTSEAPQVLDNQELERLNESLRNTYLTLNHRLGRLTVLFAGSEPTGAGQVTHLQEVFEDLVTAARHGLRAAEQLTEHQRAVERENTREDTA